MEKKIEIYKTPQGTEINVKLENDSLWLDAHTIAELFGVNRPAIVKHIGNIFKTSEPDENLTCSILEQVASDGKRRKMNFYNLDMILSVGYRVNSSQATKFRQWATQRLKDYLVQGYGKLMKCYIPLFILSLSNILKEDYGSKPSYAFGFVSKRD